jgi:hypothetical protein
MTMDRKRDMLSRTAILAGVLTLAGNGYAGFSSPERARVTEFWALPERYTVVMPPTLEQSGPFQVRLTSAGSVWLWNYGNARGLSKGAMLNGAPPANEQQRGWENWIDAKVAWDRWEAGRQATEQNTKRLGRNAPDLAGARPRDPGPIPASLKALVGDPPSFAAAVEIKQHVVTFPDGTVIALNDCPPMRPRYPFFRFEAGVMCGGSPVRSMSDEDLNKLFRDAKIPVETQRVFKAVSLLEGGFDSVNTYDTGFVSVGFIQFASLSRGSGSLGQVLLRHKQNHANSFDDDFRRFGLDVTDGGELIALCLETGEEHVGAAANRRIIEDKRLISVFKRAGQKSQQFRVAQLQIAHEQYYPGNDTITVTIGGRSVTGKVSDVVQSEAGLATLMDRKVNTGNLSPLPWVLNQLAGQVGARSLEDLAGYERNIIQSMRFRKDYLADNSLSQPSIAANRAQGSQMSRGGQSRRGRGK